MFKNLRVITDRESVVPDPIELTISGLQRSPDEPISLRSLNNLHENVTERVYRALIPYSLLHQFNIDPIRWTGPDKESYVALEAPAGSGKVLLQVWAPVDPTDPILKLELADNTFNSLDLNLIILNDPASPRFDTDVDDEGQPTMYGTMSRNLAAEAAAKEAGLAPAQVRAGLSGSRMVLGQIEPFIATLGHRAYYLEPLSYASAWVFERRGFAYTRGHALMETIHAEFQPGGALHAALDGSSPFRQPDQWQTIRGRAWAIHDGVLAAIDAAWTDLRMVKRLGRDASVNTAPDVNY